MTDSMVAAADYTINYLPTIASVSASVGGAGVSCVVHGTVVTFSVVATDPENDTLTANWDFRDGTKAQGMSVEHAFGVGTVFDQPLDVTVTVSDAASSAAGGVQLTVLGPSSGGTGVKNISDESQCKIENPLNGMSIRVANSDGGAVELCVDVQALMRDQFA
jgi:hypothetical protein